MNYQRLIQVISIFALLVAVANILLFAFHIISSAVMWIVIVILALIAWPGINYLRKKAGKQQSFTKSRGSSRKK